MTIYRINTSWGEPVHFEADLVQASAPIRNVDDETLEVGGSTQYQTADARHDMDEAARLYMALLGREFYASDADADQTDEELIEAAIVDVTALDD